jgi:hypothetical protein
MVKARIKKVIKSSLIKTRDFILQLNEEPNGAPKTERDFSHADSAYPWLNSIFTRLAIVRPGIFRPSYTWGLLHSAHLAKALGIDRISAIEFGVAGGNGLVSLEKIAEEVEKALGVGIDIYGFDTGVGLPKPDDYRDLPNLYTAAAFPMDIKKLKDRLNKAQLILGEINGTIDGFIRSMPAPVAFVSVDVDYYSSTMHIFRLFDADHRILLPRIHCYFDDITGFTHSDFTGERLAIADFNASHAIRKISPIYGVRHFLPAPTSHGEWPEKYYMAHFFDHPMYGASDGLWRRPFGSSADLRA